MREPARRHGPQPSALSPAFTWPIRVYWEDTDAGGVVYHASYLRFLERARTEWLRAQGVEQQRVRNDDGVVFVVRNLEIEFLLPARLDDELDVTVESGEWRSASMTFVQRIVRRVDGAVVAGARVREEHGILFVVADMQLHFLAPARLDDELEVCVNGFTRRSASLVFTQCILRPADGVTLIQAQVRAACIDAVTYKPVRIPDFLLHS